MHQSIFIYLGRILAIMDIESYTHRGRYISNTNAPKVKEDHTEIHQLNTQRSLIHVPFLQF